MQPRTAIAMNTEKGSRKMIKEVTVEDVEKELEQGITIDGNDFNMTYQSTEDEIMEEDDF